MIAAEPSEAGPGASDRADEPPAGSRDAMRVLVLNSGSSSLKYQVLDPLSARRFAAGSIDRIGEDDSHIEHATGTAPVASRVAHVPDHAAAFAEMLAALRGDATTLAGLDAIGHRVVMGGRNHDRAVIADEAVQRSIEQMVPFAPLHNPSNLAGIRLARREFPDVANVAVFDTAFFAHLPAPAATYAIDSVVARRLSLSRHGAHGTSHRYVSRLAAARLGPESASRIVVLHLGNGASASAVLNGMAVETSMGVTPLEGLVMGTRSGDVDPALPGLLQSMGDMSAAEVDRFLNTRCGLVGLCGHRDMRDVHRAIAAGDPSAQLALEVYLHRTRKYVGAYAAVMGGIDALVFTAGVGENDPVVRSGVVDGLGFLGLEVDQQLNGAVGASRGTAQVISPPGSAASVMVVPTDEELAIAREVAELLGSATP